MGLRPGDLDRRITFLLPTAGDDGLAVSAGAPQAIGQRWASKADVSDGERVRAAQNGQEVTTRFVVRWDSLTTTITGKHLLSCEGRTYAVVGTKEVGERHEGIEITANAQPDIAS